MHSKVRHSKEDALGQREFQLLLEGAQKMRDYYGQQARFIILVGGRLGLRKGEIAHMSEEWIDWRRSMIDIPIRTTARKAKTTGSVATAGSSPTSARTTTRTSRLKTPKPCSGSPKPTSRTRRPVRLLAARLVGDGTVL